MFVDEFGINVDMTRRYARSPRGMRAVGSIPLRTGGNITLVFGLRGSKILAPRMLLGGMSKEKFTFYAETMLGPSLKPGDQVSLSIDRLGTLDRGGGLHRGADDLHGCSPGRRQPIADRRAGKGDRRAAQPREHARKRGRVATGAGRAGLCPTRP